MAIRNPSCQGPKGLEVVMVQKKSLTRDTQLECLVIRDARVIGEMMPFKHMITEGGGDGLQSGRQCSQNFVIRMIIDWLYH